MSVRAALPAGSLGPPPDQAELLIIGGGIMGLALAYQAAKLGQKGIVVLERRYLCSGASGRNGGGVRMQWSNPDDIRLMQGSVQICKHFAQEMGFNVWFRQGGYLFLIKQHQQLEALTKNVSMQNACGVPTRILSPAQAHQLVPELNLNDIVAASYNPEDGVLFPWPFIWAYASRAIELNVALHTFAEVVELEVTGGRIDRVHVRGTGDQEPWHKSMGVGHVVNATGAYASELAQRLGIDIPSQPFRHEILTTEPLKSFLKPMVTVLGEGIYFSQAMRGEIVGGMGDKDEPSSYDQSSSLEFLRRFARSATQLMPLLGHVQVVRQWAGLYDVSPDGRPIIGEPAAMPNMTLLSGFTGHGFMMAPMIGKLCAERLVKGTRADYFEKNSPDRFRQGIGSNQESMIIG